MKGTQYAPRESILCMEHFVALQCMLECCCEVYKYEISNNAVFATSKGTDKPAHTRSLIRAFASCLNIL